MLVDPEALLSVLPELSPLDRTFGLCGAGKTRCAITPAGSLLPCDILRSLDCGNVYEHGFKSVWECSSELRRLRNRRERATGSCTRCPVFDYCVGECPQYALMNHGTFDRVEPVCGAHPGQDEASA